MLINAAGKEHNKPGKIHTLCLSQQRACGTSSKIPLIFSFNFLLCCAFFSAFAASTHAWAVRKKQYWSWITKYWRLSPNTEEGPTLQSRPAEKQCNCFLFFFQAQQKWLTSPNEHPPSPFWVSNGAFTSPGPDSVHGMQSCDSRHWAE